jgi:hypothetical protein
MNVWLLLEMVSTNYWNLIKIVAPILGENSHFGSWSRSQGSLEGGKAGMFIFTGTNLFLIWGEDKNI